MAAMISIAFVLNLVALLANFAAYATPWQRVYDIGKEFSEGYWGICIGGKDCTWFFKDGFRPLREGAGNKYSYNQPESRYKLH